MGYPERLLTDDETVVHDFHPHWKMLVPAVAIAVLLGAAAWGTWQLPPPDDLVDRVVTAVLAVAVVAVLGSAFLRWWFTQYVLTTERLIVRTGIVARSGLEIPLEQINNVGFSQGLTERILRFGDLVIESAGSTGRSQLDNIPDPESFQSEIYRTRDERMSVRSGGAGLSIVEQLERMEGLRDRGTLTHAEFETKKRRLLES